MYFNGSRRSMHLSFTLVESFSLSTFSFLFTVFTVGEKKVFFGTSFEVFINKAFVHDTFLFFFFHGDSGYYTASVLLCWINMISFFKVNSTRTFNASYRFLLSSSIFYCTWFYFLSACLFICSFAAGGLIHSLHHKAWNQFTPKIRWVIRG